MRKIYFHIHKGHPLDPEDNREEVNELHVLVEFSTPEIHASLMDWIDNTPRLGENAAQMYERNEKTGQGVIDVAMPVGIDEPEALQIVRSSIELYCSRNNYDAHIFIKEPTC